MAFVQVETWRAAPVPRAAMLHAASVPGPLQVALANGRDIYLRRIFATGISIIVHLCLIWFLIHRLSDGTGTGSAAGEGTGEMTTIDLTGPKALEVALPATAQTQAQAAPPSALVASEMDLSRPADLPLPEWSVSSIRVERAPAPVSPQAAPSNAQSATAAAGGGATGNAAGGHGAGYDPYAGAAPMRREGSAPAVRSVIGQMLDFVGFGEGAEGGLELDKTLLETALRAANRAYPKARGTVLFVVHVSPTGVALAIDVKKGNASPEGTSALRKALLGKRLFLVKSAMPAPKLVSLPPIRFGGEL